MLTRDSDFAKLSEFLCEVCQRARLLKLLNAAASFLSAIIQRVGFRSEAMAIAIILSKGLQSVCCLPGTWSATVVAKSSLECPFRVKCQRLEKARCLVR